MTLVKLTCNWIVDWSVLQIKNPERRLLMLGVKLIERVANEISKHCKDGDPESYDWKDEVFLVAACLRFGVASSSISATCGLG